MKSCLTVPLRRQAVWPGIIPADALPPKWRLTISRKKHVKKPNGSKPGFVVYYTNYSLIIEPDITGIRLVED